ncbi:MAG: DUF2304 domain-containing protein [Patescibacteria group bacterium]|jgi:hypothetical protein
MGFQILMVLFATYSIWRAWSAYRTDGIDRRKLVLWVVIWLGAVVIVFQPARTDTLAAFLGVGRGVDAVFFLVIPTLFFLVFQLTRKVDRFDRTITTLVQELALSDEARKRIPNDRT